VSSQEITDGSLLPLTPNAARPSDDADDADHHGLPERDPEPEHERSVAQAEHGHVRGEPGPEQVTWMALAFGVGDDVDAVHLDLQRSQFDLAGSYRAADSLIFSHGTPHSCRSCRVLLRQSLY
jgi:hypothetical protein